jgi:hypothetical protein
LDQIEASVPADLDVHLVMDNYATHKPIFIHSSATSFAYRISFGAC